MPSPFNEEIDAGFAELAAEAGTAADGATLTFKGVEIDGGGVLDVASDEPIKVDTKMGRARRCRLTVTRSAIGSLAAKPKAGESFELGAKNLRIEDIDDEDPTERTIAYIVKVSG